MKRLKPLYFIPILVLLLSAAIWFLFFRQKIIVVIINGEVQGVTTDAITVRGVLRDASITLHPQDQVEPSLGNWIKNKEIIYVTQSSLITLTVDDQIFHFYSSGRTPQQIIIQAGVEISQNSIAFVNGKPFYLQDEIPYSTEQQIEINEPVDIQFSIDSSIQEFNSAAKSIADLLWMNDIPIYEGSSLQTHLDYPLVDADESISYSQAGSVNIETQYRDFSIPISKVNSGHALAQAGNALQFLDYINNEEGSPILDTKPIKIISVSETITLDQQLINFETQRQPLPDLEIDNQKLVQSGQYGLEAQRIRVRYENGQEVSRKKEDTWVARESVPRIEGYGTKIVIRTTNTDHGTIEYWRSLEFYATSYSASRSGVSPDKSWYGHVYCGGVLKNGYVAVDLSYIPCDTQLYIPGYGYATAMDTGSISGAWIDLGYEDKDYIAWHQNVTVYFLTPVPSLDSIAYTIPTGSAP